MRTQHHCLSRTVTSYRLGYRGSHTPVPWFLLAALLPATIGCVLTPPIPTRRGCGGGGGEGKGTVGHGSSVARRSHGCVRSPGMKSVGHCPGKTGVQGSNPAGRSFLLLYVAKVGSTSGIRAQYPCLSGTVPSRLGYRGSHTLMGASCFTAPPPKQSATSGTIIGVWCMVAVDNV